MRPLVPPLPHGNSRGDLALQRGALGGVGKISKTRLAEWLGRAGLDPNDPRNAWCPTPPASRHQPKIEACQSLIAFALERFAGFLTDAPPTPPPRSPQVPGAVEDKGGASCSGWAPSRRVLQA